MDTLPCRRQIPHWEHSGGTVCLTWRLHRDQRRLEDAEREVVFDVLRKCGPEFGEILTAVVMDDHVHVLARPARDVTAQRLASCWKGASSHRLCAECGRRAPVWQRAYFDRWMRSEDQSIACAQYIVDNPRRRWPEVEDYQWLIHPR